MNKTLGRLIEVSALVPGAVATGVVREVVGAKINPTWQTVPVAKAAYVMDGVGAAIGIGLLAVGVMTGNRIIENLGVGVAVPSVTYLSQNATHDIKRKLADKQVAAVAPKAIMLAAEPPRLDRVTAQNLSEGVFAAQEELVPLAEEY